MVNFMSLSLIGVGKFVWAINVCGLGCTALSIDVYFIEPTPEAPQPKERPLEFETKAEEAPEPFKEQVIEDRPLERMETETVVKDGRLQISE